jgi:hypothetical protein
MPSVYLAATISASVTFDGKDDFTYEEWTDKKLAKERAGNKRSNLGLWLEIENPDDSSQVFPIPVNDADVYEGTFEVVQNGLTFDFKFDAKAKPSIHKTTKEKIDQGLKPKLRGLVVNGQQYAVDEDVNVQLSSKKI